jgi:uncharacterized membrane protein
MGRNQAIRRARPISSRALLPLVLFFLVLSSFWTTVTTMDWIVFTRPGAFWLFGSAPWFWWLHQRGRHGLSGARSATAVFLRLILSGVLVLLLAEPRAVRKSDRLAIMYALDMSDSVGEATRERALSFIVNSVQQKPEKDLAGLVVFGRDAAVELPPRVSFPFDTVNVRVARDGTSLERALSLAGAMLPDDHAGRILLISDGTETEGNVMSALRLLRGRGIPIDVLPIEYEHGREVWMEKLDLPRRVRLGETMEASVVVSALQEGTGTLKFKENGRVIQEQSVSFRAGKTRLVLPLYLRSPGHYEYEAVIEPSPGDDGWENNNRVLGAVTLRGRGKVLVVESPEDNQRDTAHLVEAMTETGMEVEVLDAYQLPQDAMSLRPFDAVLFANVPADVLDPMQMQGIRDAVYYQGMGFVMVGGPNSFGPGGYHRTQIEEILPVQMDVKQTKVLPKGALAMVLHTCEFEQGNTWGKRIAKEAIRVLGERDEAGVLVYSYGNSRTGEQWLFPMTPVSEYARMVQLINQAQIGDMPSFALTMEMGLEALQQSDAAAKHMIIISDGDPSPPTPELVQKFVESKISVSTVLINPHGGQEIMLMRVLARHTGGRFYFPANPAQLPSIFVKEAKTLKRSMIQNFTFLPRLGLPSPVMKGVDALPALHGYVITTPKPRAQILVEVDGEQGTDPILALWRFGLGSTAAFTSDLAANWGRDWVYWTHYQPVVRQLMTAITRVEQPSHLRLVCEADGSYGRVDIEDQHPDAAFLELAAEVMGPRGVARTLEFKHVGPRRYQASFPLDGVGRYQVMVAASSGERTETALGAFTVPYSPEYLRFRSSPALLRRLAEESGGRLLTGSEPGAELFNPVRQTRLYSRPIHSVFLWVLAFLIPLDVAVRRVQWDGAVLRDWLARRVPGEPTQTLDALRRVKDSAGDRIPASPRAPVRGRPPAESAPESEAKPDSPPPVERSRRPAPSSKGSDSGTTTGRLLAKKRTWKQEDES